MDHFRARDTLAGCIGFERRPETRRGAEPDLRVPTCMLGAKEEGEMQGEWLWDVTVKEDGSRELDGGIFTTPNGNLTFAFRPEDRPVSNDAAGRARIKAKLVSVVELLAANLDKV